MYTDYSFHYIIALQTNIQLCEIMSQVKVYDAR